MVQREESAKNCRGKGVGGGETCGGCAGRSGVGNRGNRNRTERERRKTKGVRESCSGGVQ